LLRVQEAIAARRFEVARSELHAVLGHGELEDYCRDHADTVRHFFNIARLYLMAGRADDALMIAERARDLAIRVGHDVGRSHYHLATVYAALGESDPNLIEEAAKQLFLAFLAHPDFQQWYRQETRWFGPVRARIDAALGRMGDPAVVRRRLRTRSSAKTTAQLAER
jgi:hypothetical protein